MTGGMAGWMRAALICFAGAVAACHPLGDPLNPKPPASRAFEPFRDAVRKFGYEPVLLPQETETFDAGYVLADVATQATLGKIRSICDRSLRGQQIYQFSSGPSEWENKLNFGFDGSSGDILSKLDSTIPGLKVSIPDSSLSHVGRIVVSFRNIRIRKVITPIIATALKDLLCVDSLQAVAPSVPVVTAVVMGTIKFEFYNESLERVKVQGILLRAGLSMHVDESGSMVSTEPLVFGYQMQTFAIERLQ